MAVTKAQQRAVNKYNCGHYDRIALVLPKGGKALIESAAGAIGESVNGYVSRAVLTRLGLDAWPAPRGNSQEHGGPGEPL